MSEFARNQNRTVDNSLLRPAQPGRTAAEPVHEVNPQPWGNQAARQFAESCPLALPSPGVCPFGGACHACPARAQAKLEVSKPDDPYEQEADRVAEQVMTMPEPKIQRACPSCEDETVQTKPLAEQITPLVQRQEEPEEEKPPEEEEEEEPAQAKLEGGSVQRQEENPEEEEEEPVQRKPEAGSSRAVTPPIQGKIRGLRGGGRPLSGADRRFYESRFGRDLSRVRLHTGTEAVEASKELHALAFTLGNDIFFGRGDFSPATQTERQLLAHELAHVIQQRGRFSAPARPETQPETRRLRDPHPRETDGILRREEEPAQNKAADGFPPQPRAVPIAKGTPAQTVAATAPTSSAAHRRIEEKEPERNGKEAPGEETTEMELPEPVQAKQFGGGSRRVGGFRPYPPGVGLPPFEPARNFFEQPFGGRFDEARTDSGGIAAEDEREAEAGDAFPAAERPTDAPAHAGTGGVAPFPRIGRLERPVIQRSPDLPASRRYRGCRGDENFFVEMAQTRAAVWVASTIADLETSLRPHQTVTVIDSTLNRFFHPPQPAPGTIGGRNSPETVRTIIRNLDRMLTVLRNPRQFRCVTRGTCRAENADHDPNALAYAGPSTRVSICPNFFNRDTQSINDQAATLIHETAHRIGLMRNVVSRERVIALPLSHALTNAESYALLVDEYLHGLPAAPPPSPPEALTENWSPAYMSSEVLYTAPVSGLFYEGRGRRRLLSSRHPSIETPFPGNQPIRFRGQVRFYVDTQEKAIPAGRQLPEVYVQILFTPAVPGGQTQTVFAHNNPRPTYLEPGLPLVVSFPVSFHFSVAQNGRLRTSIWMMDPTTHDFYAGYEDTITVRPDNDV